MARILMAMLAFLVAGCETVQEHRLIVQPLNTTLTASVGATLFHMNKKGDLPNAVGGKDIFGGKVSKGFSAVKLAGIRDERFVDLLAFEVARDSSETTMDRYRPPGNALVSVNMSQTVNVGMSDGGIKATVDTLREKEYTLDGIRVRFLEVRPSSVVYVLEDVNSQHR